MESMEWSPTHAVAVPGLNLTQLLELNQPGLSSNRFDLTQPGLLSPQPHIRLRYGTHHTPSRSRRRPIGPIPSIPKSSGVGLSNDPRRRGYQSTVRFGSLGVRPRRSALDVRPMADKPACLRFDDKPASIGIRGFTARSSYIDTSPTVGIRPSRLRLNTSTSLGIRPSAPSRSYLDTPANVGIRPSRLHLETPASVGFRPSRLRLDTPASVGTRPFAPVPSYLETPANDESRPSIDRDTLNTLQRDIDSLHVPGEWPQTPTLPSEPLALIRTLKRKFDEIDDSDIIDDQELAKLHVPGEWPVSFNESELTYIHDGRPSTITRIALRTQQFKRRCVDITDKATRPVFQTAHTVAGTSRKIMNAVTGTTKFTMHAVVRAYNATKRFNSHVNTRIREAMSRARRQSTIIEVRLPEELLREPQEQLSAPVNRQTDKFELFMSMLFKDHDDDLDVYDEGAESFTTASSGAEEDSTILSSTVPEDITLQTHLFDEEDLATPVSPYVDVSFLDSVDYNTTPAPLQPESPVKINPEILARRELRLQKKKEEEERKLAEENRRAQQERERSAFGPLTQEQLAEVSGVLGRGFGEFKPRDLARVVPTGRGGATEGWLNDEVINAYLNIIAKGANQSLAVDKKKYHAFNSFFYKNIIEKGYGGVQRWAKRAKLEPQHIMTMEAIYVPVNSGNHWTLLVIKPAAKTVQYYDSMNGSGQRAMSAAKAWLSGELKDLYQESEWSFDFSTPSPQQDNYSDCGVFTITTAKLLTLGIDPLAYGPADIPMQRKRIVYELKQGGLL